MLERLIKQNVRCFSKVERIIIQHYVSNFEDQTVVRTMVDDVKESYFSAGRIQGLCCLMLTVHLRRQLGLSSASQSQNSRHR
jgi:hypothetical protein